MTNEERLAFCKTCKNRELDQQLEIVCGITKKTPAFEGSCENYVDERKVQQTIIDDSTYSISDLSDEVKTKLREQQDIFFAIVGASAAALVGAVLWALITVSTKYQIGYMAIGVGALVGFSVRYYGAGVDKIFGVIGVVFALIGCTLGNLLSQVAFIAKEQNVGYLDVISFLNVSLTIEILKEAFSPMDLLFYGIAGYEGYKFAFRKISSQDLHDIESNQPVSLLFAKFRIPTVAILFVVLSLSVYFLFKNSGGVITYKYESGAKHYEGATENGLETGIWTYWWENGNLQQKGFFKEGKQDSTWESYDEDGILSRRNSYKLNNQHGTYEEFFNNGQASVKGQYVNGRQTGLWKFYNDNGKISQQGYYYMDHPDSLWETFYSNGQIKSKGKFHRGEQRGVWYYYFENGSPSLESDYGDDGKLLIRNVWNEAGGQMIKDGNGVYYNYHPNGLVNETGKIVQGKRVGIWKTFSSQKKLLEEGEFKNGMYYVINSWSFNGKPMVVNGDGEYENYHNDSTGLVKEGGKIVKGLRTHEWEVLSMEKNVVQKSNYMNGLLEGNFQTLFESGQASAEGSFHEDKRSGDWTWYYEDGKTESTISYVNGKKNGTQLFFGRDDKTLRTETYQDGELQTVTLTR
ncbi:MAG TPA: hypothetical protein DGG95_17015 [Cytophagales bacterium]|jgi:antitoxin component YwqK of YwqJK toxin-antitoxin module|nr:hypothetical protein [Cytophagales bacterium]